MIEEEREAPNIAPEDCDVCGCPAGEFDDSDYRDGCWHCPNCGAIE